MARRICITQLQHMPRLDEPVSVSSSAIRCHCIETAQPVIEQLTADGGLENPVQFLTPNNCEVSTAPPSMAVSDTCRVGNIYHFQPVARCVLIIRCASDNCMRHRVRQWLIGNICMIMYPYLIIIIIIIFLSPPAQSL